MRSRLAFSSAARRAPCSSAPARAVAAACWNGVPPAKVMNCLAPRVAATSSAGPHAQPVFQPVTENVLPIEDTVSVRSAMPGSVASGTCSPSNTRCS